MELDTTLQHYGNQHYYTTTLREVALLTYRISLLQDTGYLTTNDKVLLTTETLQYYYDDMTGIKTTPVNQSSEYKMENLSHWIKLDICQSHLNYKDMTYILLLLYDTRRVTLGIMSLITKIENHQLAMNKRMAIMHMHILYA